MSRFIMTQKKYEDMKRGVKSPLAFFKLVGKVVEFELEPEIAKTELHVAVETRDVFYSFPDGTKLTGIVKMSDPDMLRAVIFITNDFFYIEGEVNVNSIRVLNTEETIIWKLTNE